MASKKTRCHYEILGLSSDCSPEEIRSAYRKLALQRHPDKLIQTGIPEKQATAAFQELSNAYEVLSDPAERAWYDSHRSKILSPDSKSSKNSSDPVPNLFPFFSNSVFSGFGDTGKGFYKVYGDIFGKIYAQEVSFARKFGLGEESVRIAPLIGNLGSAYDRVTAFYKYWLRFCTVMDFDWVDEYDVMAEPDRKSRRLMEEENKKLRTRARREYIETVRGLARYAKKRDKRVIDMQMKRELEQEKKREEEKARKKEAERARMYEDEDEDDEDNDSRENDVNVLYCVVCRKKFKSDKQWKNHEKSKKHREKVAELGDTTFHTEDKDDEEHEGGKEDGDADFGPSTSVDSVVHEQFENDIGFREEKSGRKSRKKSTKSQLRAESEDIDFMEYNIRRNAPRDRATKRVSARISKEEAVSMGMGGDTEEAIPDSSGNDSRGVEDSLNAHVPEEVDLDNRRNPLLNKNQKVTNPQIKKKDTGKGDTNTKMRNTSRGKDQEERTSLWLVSDARHNTGVTRDGIGRALAVDHTQATSILWWALLCVGFYILSGFYID